MHNIKKKTSKTARLKSIYLSKFSTKDRLPKNVQYKKMGFIWKK